MSRVLSQQKGRCRAKISQSPAEEEGETGKPYDNGNSSMKAHIYILWRRMGGDEEKGGYRSCQLALPCPALHGTVHHITVRPRDAPEHAVRGDA